MDGFAVVGTNHKFAPLEVRERLALPDGKLPDALRALRDQYGLSQAVVLSTCNRVEVISYSTVPDPAGAIESFLAAACGIPAGHLRPHLYNHRGPAAIEHVFRVAASLDSLVLGETQILGQLKSAYHIAAGERATGKAINALMHRAFNVAKLLHSETGIGRGQFSVASAAVTFIRRIFDDLRRKTALLVGVGETGQLALRHLREAGIGRVLVANRTMSKAQEVADAFGGTVVPYESISASLHEADIVVTQTAAPQPVILRPEVQSAMRRRGYRPMFFVDLAVPRNVAPDAGDVEGVYRYDIDDLQRVVDDAGEARCREMQRCNGMLQQEVASFQRTFRTLGADPLITALRGHADALIESELSRLTASAGSVQVEEAREMLRRTVNKLLHGPVTRLKDLAARGELDASTVDALSGIFELPLPDCTGNPETARLIQPVIASSPAAGPSAPAESAIDDSTGAASGSVPSGRRAVQEPRGRVAFGGATP